jgi:hypothetical protein
MTDPGSTTCADTSVVTFGAARASVVSVASAHGAVYAPVAGPSAIASWYV